MSFNHDNHSATAAAYEERPTFDLQDAIERRLEDDDSDRMELLKSVIDDDSDVAEMVRNALAVIFDSTSKSDHILSACGRLTTYGQRILRAKVMRLEGVA